MIKYYAKHEIAGYKKGEEVPADKAETWLKMYTTSPVDIVDTEVPVPVKKVEVPIVPKEEKVGVEKKPFLTNRKSKLFG